METFKTLKTSIVIFAATCALFSGLAQAYTGDEAKGDINEAEMQVQMVRMFLDTLKLNVTAEQGDFDLLQYPAGGEQFNDVARYARVSKTVGSINIDGESIATSHKIEIRTKVESYHGSANRLELVALLGISPEGGHIGSLSVAAGNEDPAQAIFTLVYRFNADGSVDIEGRDNSGWSFDRDSNEGGVIECRNSLGEVSSYDSHSGQGCSLTSDQWTQAEQLFHEGRTFEEIKTSLGIVCM